MAAVVLRRSSGALLDCDPFISERRRRVIGAAFETPAFETPAFRQALLPDENALGAWASMAQCVLSRGFGAFSDQIKSGKSQAAP